MKWKARVPLGAVLAVLVACSAGPLAAQEQSAAKKAPKYTVIDLGTLSGGSFSQATAANDTGVQSGLSDAPDGFQHAVLWHDSKITDISNHFPASTNSGAFSLNNSGQVLLDGELTTKDPNNENFCAYGTGLICRAYVWRNGSMAPLPTLGGPNNLVTWINDQGLATGIAETSKHDSTCPGTITPGGTGPQSLQFEGVLWGPFPGGVRVMRPLPGDTASMAFAVNRQGLVVGGSGSCSDTFLPGPAVAPHAVFWENGVPASMGNLGGTSNPDLFGIGTIAYVVNDNGTAVGEAALPGNATAHAFLWSKKLHHLKDLGTLPGDVHTAGLGLNNLDDVVGPSFDPDGNPRAYLYKDGTMYDLNALAGDDSPIYMLVAYGVNDHDEVVGFGVDANGDVHGFLATPNGVCDGTGDGKPRAIMSERAKEFLRHRLPYGWFEPKR